MKTQVLRQLFEARPNDVAESTSPKAKIFILMALSTYTYRQLAVYADPWESKLTVPRFVHTMQPDGQAGVATDCAQLFFVKASTHLGPNTIKYR